MFKKVFGPHPTPKIFSSDFYLSQDHAWETLKNPEIRQNPENLHPWIGNKNRIWFLPARKFIFYHLRARLFISFIPLQGIWRPQYLFFYFQPLHQSNGRALTQKRTFSFQSVIFRKLNSQLLYSYIHNSEKMPIKSY